MRSVLTGVYSAWDMVSVWPCWAFCPLHRDTWLHYKASFCSFYCLGTYHRYTLGRLGQFSSFPRTQQILIQNLNLSHELDTIARPPPQSTPMVGITFSWERLGRAAGSLSLPESLVHWAYTCDSEVGAKPQPDVGQFLLLSRWSFCEWLSRPQPLAVTCRQGRMRGARLWRLPWRRAALASSGTDNKAPIDLQARGSASCTPKLFICF